MRFDNQKEAAFTAELVEAAAKGIGGMFAEAWTGSGGDKQAAGAKDNSDPFFNLIKSAVCPFMQAYLKDLGDVKFK